MLKQSILLISMFIVTCATNKPYVQTEIKVPTIQCEMCEHNIESALNDVDGVKKILVNSQTKSVSIKYDSSVVSLKQFESVIAKTGYQANRIKPENKDHYERSIREFDHRLNIESDIDTFRKQDEPTIYLAIQYKFGNI